MIKLNLIGSVREREIGLSSKFLLVILSSAITKLAVGIALLVTQPVWAEETGRLGERETRGEGALETNQIASAEDLVAQGVTRVTGVEVIQTESGLELILKTIRGSERLVPLIVPEGNDLVIDILDATLAFSIRNGVTELNPAPGISRVTVNKGDENSVRVRVSGTNQTPSAEIVPGRDDLVLSIAPEDTTIETEPDEQIDIIATGEAEEDDYKVDNASTATRTDTPLRDIPQSIQVVPQQVGPDFFTHQLGRLATQHVHLHRGLNRPQVELLVPTRAVQLGQVLLGVPLRVEQRRDQDD